MGKQEIKRDFILWLKEIFTGERFLSWKAELYQHKFLILLSLFFVIIAAGLDFLAGNYVTEVGVAVSPDIILDHIGPYNLQIFFGWGYLIVMFLFFFFPLLFKIRMFHKVLSQFSLIVILRSFFISLTHLKTPLTAIAPKFPAIFQPFVFENDLFFSGHVATTFLGFLVFKEFKIKYFFLIASFFLGAVTLLMHRHYSIDVFAAFFITYCSYKMGEYFFRKIEGEKY